jgi:hypothetical protein
VADNARLARLHARVVTNPDRLSLEARAEQMLALKIAEGVVRRPGSAHLIDELLADEKQTIKLAEEMGGPEWNPYGAVPEAELNELREAELDALIGGGPRASDVNRALDRRREAEMILGKSDPALKEAS